MRKEVEHLATSLAAVYSNREAAGASVDRSKYSFAPNGAFYKHAKDGGAALWVSGATPITDEVREIAFFTEAIDPELIRITREFPEVAQAYYNDRNSLNRIYPWFDAIAQYPPKMNIPEFNFYYLADAAHNPGKRALWVDEPYVDPAGRGWMVSAISPVYEGDELVGVAGLDVTIGEIVGRYLNAHEVPVAVVAKNGVLVAASERAIELMEMPSLKDHKYLETVKQDIFQPDEYNVFKSPVRAVRDMAVEVLQKHQPKAEVKLAGKPYVAVASPVPELGWTILEFVSK